MLELLRPVQVGGGHLAILDSSFNPPSAAHHAIASSSFPGHPGCERVNYTARLLLYSPRNADKVPGSTDATTEQRSEMMRLLAEHMSGTGQETGAALLALPTFAQKADHLAERFPDAHLTFLVGTDTLTRVFDPKYYDDMDRALDHLFERAHLVCCARGADADAVLHEHPKIQDWARRGNVRFIDAVGEVSSTAIRRAVQNGDWELAERLCAPDVGEYVRKEGLYR